MKKLFNLALGVVMIFIAVGCGKSAVSQIYAIVTVGDLAGFRAAKLELTVGFAGKTGGNIAGAVFVSLHCYGLVSEATGVGGVSVAELQCIGAAGITGVDDQVSSARVYAVCIQLIPFDYLRSVGKRYRR